MNEEGASEQVVKRREGVLIASLIWSPWCVAAGETGIYSEVLWTVAQSKIALSVQVNNKAKTIV